MTEPQFLEIVKQQELKTRRTVEGERVTYPIALGGCRDVTPDGWRIGSFIDVLGEGKVPSGRVQFMRIMVK